MFLNSVGISASINIEHKPKCKKPNNYERVNLIKTILEYITKYLKMMRFSMIFIY